MNFESLVGHINQVQDVLQAQAALSSSGILPILQTASAKLQTSENQTDEILRLTTAKSEESMVVIEKLRTL